MTLNPLDYPICFEKPRRAKIATWQPNIPFAMFLVAALKPRTIVELGTYFGDSYCAFCQAVQQLSLATTCNAVDTWLGDPQTGFYGAEVLADLRAHHDPLYASFSTLIQATFDDAVDRFVDGSIDLLHIDGSHTYEAVKHDFETWLPKVSSQGIVLIHDINVYESGFGVWQLWQELERTYSCFVLPFSYGLGVVAVGREIPDAIRPLFDAHEPEVSAIVRFFQAVGDRTDTNRLQLVEHESSEVREQLQQLQLQVHGLDRQLREAFDHTEAIVQRHDRQPKKAFDHTEAIAQRHDRQLKEAVDHTEAIAQRHDRQLKEAVDHNSGISQRYDEQLQAADRRLGELRLKTSIQSRQLRRITIASQQLLHHAESTTSVLSDYGERISRIAEVVPRVDALEGAHGRLSGELNGFLEGVRLLVDLQHRIGVPITMSGVSRRIHTIDQHLKTLGRRIRGTAEPVQRRDLGSDASTTVLVQDTQPNRPLSVPPVVDQPAMIVFRPLLALAVLIGALIVLMLVTAAILVVGAASRLRRRSETVIRTDHAIVASIVIPTWNARDLLEQCLPSIVDDVAATEGGHEIIVVDNASTDDSDRLLAERFPSVRVVRMETNEGFGGGCNAGARVARGRYVVVLNNDMKVEPGFLRELLAGFQHPDTFAVTAQIFFWDEDRYREETGLTRGGFSHGQLWLTHDRPDDDGELCPAVFYAGGGSTAYDRDKYLTIGGFDALYHPFYVEDVDLSYRAWRRGWPSVFAPRARVLHKHRGTIGKHFDERFIRDMVERNKMLFTWRNVSNPVILASGALSHSGRLAAGALRGALNLRPLRLALSRLPAALTRVWRDRRNDAWSDDRVIKTATDRFYFRDCYAPVLAPSMDARLKIVVMSPYALFPPRHGGATRMYNIVKRLASRHSVRVLSFVDTEEEQREMAELESLGVQVTTVLRRPVQPRYDGLGAIPLSVGDFDMPQMREALRSPTIAEADVFHVEYTQMAHFIRPSRHILNVLAEVDVSFLSLFRAMRHQPWLMPRLAGWYDWLRMFNYELDVCRRTDLVLAVSQDEADLLRSYLPTHPISAAAPTGVDVSHFQPRDQQSVEPFSVLFVGYFRHPPNVDAVLQLGRTIFPRLKEQHPSATLTIVGAHPPPDVRALAADSAIRVLGYVDDVRDFYRTHAVLAAPIRSGAGTRVKILEAMAAGVPVVSTTIGAEGILCQSGVDILIADDPEGFVRELARILTSPAYAQSIALAARQLVSTRYDWDAIVGNLEQLYFEYLHEKRQPSRPTD